MYHGGQYLDELVSHTYPVVSITMKNATQYTIDTFNVPGLLATLGGNAAPGRVRDSVWQTVSITTTGNTRSQKHCRLIVHDSPRGRVVSVRDSLGFDVIEPMLATVALQHMQDHLGSYEGLMQAYGFSYRDSTIIFPASAPVATLFYQHDRQAIKTIRKLSGFLNDAALAQGDKQLAKVVESYALPVGSYKRKRNSWHSIDLDAFAGPYVGYEKTAASHLDARHGDGPIYGFSVPVGLSYAKTFSRARWRRGKPLTEEYTLNPDKIKIGRRGLRERGHMTLTATFSIIDIGAVVSYRMGHTADTVLPQSVRWEQLVSPGLHLGLAIPGTPLTLMTGAQYTPGLRRFSADAEKQYNAWRAYLGVFFDLPLLNFWEQRRITGR